MSASNSHNAEARVLQRLRRRNAMLVKALDFAVWRNRAHFPNDPFCFLCGAGKKWAKQHGHQRNCALSRGTKP